MEQLNNPLGGSLYLSLIAFPDTAIRFQGATCQRPQLNQNQKSFNAGGVLFE